MTTLLMSLLVQVPVAIGKVAIKNDPIMRRAQRHCSSASSLAIERYRNTKVKSRICDSSSLILNKQQQKNVLKGNHTRSTTCMVTVNYNLDFIHRLSSTTIDANYSGDNRKKQKEEESNKNSPQMPDKDTELRLADLQATITETYKRGDFRQALKSSQDLLKQTQQHFGYNTDHPATASAMNNVGLMQKLLGNFTEGRQHYVGAMRIYASVCGRDHASYAMTLHNLGNLNKTQVHFDTSLKATERLSLVEAAMNYLEEAYAIRIAELGIEHPHTVATRSAIGSTLAAQVLYQHKLVEVDCEISEKKSRKQYVALDPQGVTEQQWRAAEEHLRESLLTATENPRGKQIQNQKNKNSKKKPKIMNHIDDNSSKIAITTLSAASAAQNLAVFLKSFSMTLDEDSPQRKQHMYEAKFFYESVLKVRSQLLSYSHPDLYATKYSLAELLEVLALSGSGDDENNNNKTEKERYQEAASTLRQEIIDTYDPTLEEEEEATGVQQVVVEKTVSKEHINN
mmetsp:Transcript_33030/g.36973  ORF Transcript_33030/g.36973 Transcript_33030/m.36973 type:complete len:511 (-) Transcript_33030:406-1938(-)